MELEKVYNPKIIEQKWCNFWIENKVFRSERETLRTPWVIVIPPPNVTGALHMGHALNNTLQDVVIRWRKMQGYNALWIPGTDHGGIATQNVYERKLKEQNKTRHDIGREQFIKEMYQWSQDTSQTIIRQLKRLGCACDWDRLCFTMDPTRATAVNEAFIRLFEQGLIYRGRRIVNWCPRCHTALADIEVEHKEESGYLWYIKYPYVDDTSDGVIVATTRPETMLGDTAVAVNPNDERYKSKIGKLVELPLVKRRIPIIADSAVESTFGTGAVKVTPSHDTADFDIADRHKLPHVRIMAIEHNTTPGGEVAGVIMSTESDRIYSYSSEGKAHPPEYRQPQRYTGTPPKTCREIVVKDLESVGLLVKTEDYKHSVGNCYRCNNVIEPMELEQWFLNTKDMAEKAIKSSEEGHVKFYPDSWEKPYLAWLNNLKDWCISRQIWWGHQIPIWYCTRCKGGYIHVVSKEPRFNGTYKSLSESGLPYEDIKNFTENLILSYGILESNEGVFPGDKPPEKCSFCENEFFVQDPDVLDTWFSSALWPFSVFNWPTENLDLKYYYPTSVLITGYEILYLWVARMVMIGETFLGKEPYKHVFVHGMVRDIHGKKMSKSLGNVIDPLVMMEEYSTDALRFSLAMASTPGRDLQLSEDSFIGARNFVNKLWNATRFVMMNIEDYNDGNDIFLQTSELKTLYDKWILLKFQNVAELVTANLNNYNLAESAKQIYDFIWHSYCDWYLELVKPRLRPENSLEDRVVAQKMLIRVLLNTTQLLHPIMPYISEEIYNILKSKLDKTNTWPKSILLTRWPIYNDSDLNITSADKLMDRPLNEIIPTATESVDTLQIFSEINTIINTTVAVRTIRSELNVPPNKKIDVFLNIHDISKHAVVLAEQENIKNLTRAAKIVVGQNLQKPEKSATAVVEGIEIFVPLGEIINLDKERERLQKRLTEIDTELSKLNTKLGNQNFLTRAPAAEVDRVKILRNDAESQRENILKNLEMLK